MAKKSAFPATTEPSKPAEDLAAAVIAQINAEPGSNTKLTNSAVPVEDGLPAHAPTEEHIYQTYGVIDRSAPLDDDDVPDFLKGYDELPTEACELHGHVLCIDCVQNGITTSEDAPATALTGEDVIAELSAGRGENDDPAGLVGKDDGVVDAKGELHPDKTEPDTLEGRLTGLLGAKTPPPAAPEPSQQAAAHETTKTAIAPAEASRGEFERMPDGSLQLVVTITPDLAEILFAWADGASETPESYIRRWVESSLEATTLSGVTGM